MPRLIAYFEPLFTLGLEAAACREAGAASATPTEWRAQALELLAQARQAALEAGQGRHAVESASFAVVAWLDETLDAGAAPGDGTPPLQHLLFNSNNAASEFFHHLSALPPEAAEIREVYWRALALGFVGQYYFERGDEGELGKLKRLHGRQLPVVPLATQSLAGERITPQARAAADPPGPRAPQRRERALLQLTAALALLLPGAWLAATLWRGQPTPASAVVQRVEQQLQGLPCTDLSIDTGPQGQVQVRGFVSRPQDIQTAERDLAALAPIRTAVDLQVRGWPHCEVAAILKPYAARNPAGAAGVRLAALNAPQGRLREGDPVRLLLTAPARDSYLWVDYYTVDGAVLHLYPGTQAARRARAGERIEIAQDIPSSWLVSPPFGPATISVLASTAPFAELPAAPPFELASDYLLRLRQALAGNGGGDTLVADLLFVTTEPR